MQGVIGYILAFTVFLSFHFLFLSVMPFSYFASYNLDLERGVVYSDEPMRFVSNYTQDGALNVQWNDTLFCETPDNGFVSFPPIMVTRLKNWTAESHKVTWEYIGGKPKENTRCYMQGVMTIFTKYGIEKSDQKKTPVFYYKIRN